MSAETINGMRESMWHLMMTFIRLGVATKRSDDWGFISKNDMEMYVTLKARQTYKLRKDTEHDVADWHNSITLPEDLRANMWGLSSVTVSTTTTNPCAEIALDEYVDLYDDGSEAYELATLDLHHQFHQSVPVLNTSGLRGKYQSRGAFEFDSS